MKTILLNCLCLTLVGVVHAESLHEQLCKFNPYWKEHHPEAREAVLIRTDADYVKLHLTQVLKQLRVNSVDQLTIRQYEQRKKLLVALEGYRDAGRFPLNHYKQLRTPVFIDEHQTYCAVGFMMRASGYDWLAKRISATDNYAWVKDIQDPDLLQWQEISGFSVEELKLIQGAYDFYDERALFLPNRIEIPQKPEVMVLFFDDEDKDQAQLSEENVWLYGEGKNGVLHGKWIQQAGRGLPWIKGFFSHGKRSGQWEEYYKGTKQLCRTEVWRNDKLNGLRRRFDRNGVLIEEIWFKEGEAITKTNFNWDQGMTFVRKPIDSLTVYTQVFTIMGEVLAEGVERINNPSGKLKWFQNIELTALNTMVLQTQSNLSSPNELNHLSGLYQQPPLVEYIKTGTWKYYREYNQVNTLVSPELKGKAQFLTFYPKMAYEILAGIFPLEERRWPAVYDSISLSYDDDGFVKDFEGYGDQKVHYQFQYFLPIELELADFGNYQGHRRRRMEPSKKLRSCGMVNDQQQPYGEWEFFDAKGKVFLRKEMVLPEEEEIEEE